MALTAAQKTTLKAAILSEATLAQYVIDRRDDLIASYYNADSNPAVTVWRTVVTRDDVSGEGFDWTQVDNMTTGQGRIWDLLFDTSTRAIDPSEAGKRAGISECWKGTAGKVAVATHVLGRCKRTANRVEALFDVGTGTEATPSVLAFEGSVSVNEISDLLNAG